MKNIRIALIAMVVLVAAAFGIYFTAKHIKNDNDKRETEEQNKLVVFDFDEDEATKLEINNESGNYIMEYNADNGWELTNTNDFIVNSYTITYICSAMSNLTAQKIIEDSDTAKYGFDDPIEITVTSNDTEYTAYVGDATATNEYVYVMKKGDGNIYLIDYTTGMVLSATKDSLKNTYLASQFSYNDIDHFALWEGAENDDNILFSMVKNEDGSWVMEKPYQDTPVYTSDIDSYITNFKRDEIYKFIQEDCKESDYEKYGFDDPSYVFELSGAGKHEKVIFGDYTNNDTELYALFENGQVVTFYKNTVTALNCNTADLMNEAVYSQDINVISEIKVKLPDNTADMTFDAANKNFTINGIKIDISDNDQYGKFLDFFYSFNNAAFETVNRKDTPTGDPEVSINYKLIDGTETTIEYIPVPGENSNTYWAIQDGEYTGFIVRKKVIANFTTTYEALAPYLK